MGNGVTVWNRLEEEHGDYKTVAHIAPDRTVTFYEEEMPQAVREEIQRIADTSEMTISATQDAPVFTVPPRAQEPPQKEEPVDPYPKLAAQVLRFVGEFDGSRMGYGEDDAQAVENIARQLHDPVQREEIRRLLQSFLDHADLEEEIAVDITLCMEQIAELPPALTPEQAQIEEIAGYLEEAGYAVSSELVEEGLMDYRAHGGKGNSQDVADFIEREFLSEEPEPASLEIAKEFINDFCEAEYGSPADFSDLEKVGIAYTTVTDEEIPIQVNADLVHYRIERYLDGQFLERRQYESLDELIQNELAELDFDQLTSVDQDYFNGKYPPDIEPYIFCEWSESPVFEDGKRYGTTYGTKRMSAYHILEQTLNQRDVRVFDYIEDENGKKKPVLNKKETAIAQDRQELIKQKFAEWIWKDIDRRELLCRVYNETFNGVRPREYDGRHIRFEGMNPEISLRPHQINAIAHILYGGNTLLAHEVGAGKTYEMVAAAMEMKRLGLCTKSLIVVPNHITEQWAAEWLQLYPSANILVATKKDFETQNRKKFCSRIATGDYDAIIIGHSQFEKIPMSLERQQAILERQIEEILEGIEQAKAQKAERYTVKQMERTRKSLETRLAKLNDQSRKDDTVTFEQLGVDRLFIDESHYFKNLFLATKMRNVGGIAQTEAQKSSDLFMKTQYLDELTGGRGVIFATGTPISNSMVSTFPSPCPLAWKIRQSICASAPLM